MQAFSAALTKTHALCKLDDLLAAVSGVDNPDAIEDTLKRLYVDACAEVVSAVHLVKMFDFVD